ncbi:MAG: hypothetical protein NZ869_03445 [Thermoanaerobaculum sp.]|nr:hypothetical protein [Thermoanaerobaculum sp.]MDW7967506.1 hypothetical protein [Thermoanaerobaculum sp.]
MKFAFLLLVALLVQAALTAPSLPWLLSAIHVWLVVVVGRARGAPAHTAGWFGLVAGLAADLSRGLPVGPSGIAGALAGVGVARASTVFELAGPLFWVIGTLLATGITEAVTAGVYASLGAPPPHSWLGAAAALAGTACLGFLTAALEWGWGRFFSPDARRRRALRRRR